MKDRTPHASELTGAQRDAWWNHDYLALLSSRLGLQGRKVAVADIGCGLEHWPALLLGQLAPGSRLVGVDRQGEWVDLACESARSKLARPDDYDFAFYQGRAESLPLGDDEFDVVTCQTLLMHLADPKQGLAEMVRVAKPGGLIVCVEPDNLLRYLGYDSLTEDRPLEELVEEYRFWLCVHRGRLAAGLGNDSVGRLLPGYFREFGLANVQVYVSDTAHCFSPPYSEPFEMGWVAQLKEWRTLWDYQLLAKNASFVEPDVGWVSARIDALQESYRRKAEAIERGEFHTSGARLLFVVAGNKPAAKGGGR